MTTFSTAFAAAAALALAAGASAGITPIATLTYDDLSGNYAPASPTSGAFSANAVSLNGLMSSGEASRLIAPLGNASFLPGFAGAFGAAAFSINISVDGVVPGAFPNPATSTGSGSFTATDVDGDTITGAVSGSWVDGSFGIIFFNGALGAVSFNDVGAADGTFNGQVGSFLLSDLAGFYPGAITQLTINTSGTGFFAGGFSGQSTGTTLQIVPAPATLALLGLGGLVANRRRR